MRRAALGIAALALVGCSRLSGCSKSAEEKNAQLVAAYLVKEGVHEGRLYGAHYEIDNGDLLLAYFPDGKTGNYKDDYFILEATVADNTVRYYDLGVNGTLDYLSGNVFGTEEQIPVSELPSEDRKENMQMYQDLIMMFGESLAEEYNVKALRKVGPQ